LKSLCNRFTAHASASLDNSSASAGVRVEPLEDRCLFSISYHVFPKINQNSNFLQNIVAAPDGNIYFSSGLANQVLSITPSGGVKVYDTTAVSPHGPSSLAVGPDGNVWFDEIFGNAMGKVNLTTHTVSKLTIASGSTLSSPVQLALGPDGNMWTSGFNFTVERITSGGVVTPFTHPGGGSGPIISFNGQLYFANGNSIYHITTGGSLSATAIQAPSKANFEALTIGPDGNLWFTEDGNTDGKAIAGVKVFLDDKNTGMFTTGDRFTTTDAIGAYKFNLAPGTYKVGTVVPSGYKAASATLVSKTITAGAITSPTTVNFSLTATAGAPQIGCPRPTRRPPRASSVRPPVPACSRSGAKPAAPAQ
jgi:hypothetical protein